MKQHMKTGLLIINVGNTTTRLGLCSGGQVRRVVRLPTGAQDIDQARAVIQKITGRRRPAGIGYCSTVPACDPLWRLLAWDEFPRTPFLQITHRLRLGIPLAYPRPETLGADRLANIAGAVALFGAPCLVMDFGTANTFNVVLAKKGFVGGVIAAGGEMMLRAMHQQTAQLPQVAARPSRARLGRSTAAAMRLGAAWGQVGQTREIIRQLSPLFAGQTPTLVATGGNAGEVCRNLRPRIKVVPQLTLFGIARLFLINTSHEVET